MDIRVTPRNIDRAIIFIDTLIKSLRLRKHRIEVGDRLTYVVVENFKIEVSLREKLKREKPTDKFGSSTYSPTGILVFKMGHLHSEEWSDNGVKIEERLSAIIEKLEYRVKLENERNRIYEERRKEEEAREKLINDEKQRVDNEIIEFKKLISVANQWNQTKILRSYINEYEVLAASENFITEEQRKWLEWAKQKIDWFDPFCNKYDDVLKGIDKSKLI